MQNRRDFLRVGEGQELRVWRGHLRGRLRAVQVKPPKAGGTGGGFGDPALPDDTTRCLGACRPP